MPFRTLKLTLSYAGTGFVGWQRQAEGTSIQGLLEDALAQFEGAPVTVHGAGRTDAGVHALGQVASARVTVSHPGEILARGLNARLPPQVRVLRVEDVPEDLHARFSARAKTYRYVIRNAHVVSPFEHAYVWHIPEPLDRTAMQEGAAAFLGAHDFAAFRSSGSEVRDTIRTITRSEYVSGARLLEPPGEPVQARQTAASESLLVYEVTGDGFLRHMVRTMVGTLVEIGRGQRTPASIPTLLASGDRAQAGATAPPQGLFLVRVDYD